MSDKDLPPIGDFLEEIFKGGTVMDMSKFSGATRLMADRLSDAYVKALHLLGKAVYSSIGMSQTDCDDCGALVSLIVIAPAGEFTKVLKDSMNNPEFKSKVQNRIKTGLESNEQKGFRVGSHTRPRKERAREPEPTRHDFKVD